MLLLPSPLLLSFLPLFLAPQDDAPEPFAPATADMVIAVGEGGDSWTLLDVVQDYAQLTGQSVRVDESTRALLEATPTGLTRSVVVPKDEVQSFVENLLADSQTFLRILRVQSPRLLAVESALVKNRVALRARAFQVLSRDLPLWRDHPALLVTTAVHLPEVDVRQLANSLRTLVTDTNVQVMLPAGASSTLILTGRAPWVADLVEIAYAVNETSGVATQPARFERFALRHADARDAAPLIEELVRSGRRLHSVAVTQPAPEVAATHPEARVLADARTNALLVVATEDDMESVRGLVALVDVPVED